MYSNQHNLYNSIQQHHDSTPHNDHYSYQTTEPRSNHPSQFFDTQHSSGHSQSPLIDFEIPSHAEPEPEPEPEPESDTCYYAPYSPDYDSGYSVNTSDNEDRDPLNWQPPIIETDFTNIDEALELKLNTADSLYRLFKAGKLKVQHVRNVSDEPTPRSLVAFSHQNSQPPPGPSLDYNLCAGVPIIWPEDMRPLVMLFPWERYHDGQDGLPFTIDTWLTRAHLLLPRVNTRTLFALRVHD
ncbi:hypothetical protein DFJ58DRAFT_873229 [Suillus subalutaceus]|uniref:uncharacterized protein n=1 Tax=Suillus subalutaceus TaxID=48586 RepID=UPI001B882312|nr:uncharacterized protein DFJ58DRAFT_873229 [Suillus subalutaceus]KAG1875633.1 hypothetical protein DFJ58DRAFT_873229 [Suillus subalutaceus]